MDISNPQAPLIKDANTSSHLEQDQLLSGKIMKIMRFANVDPTKFANFTSFTLINDESPLSIFKTHKICQNLSQFKNLRSFIFQNKGQIDSHEVILLCTAISKLINLQTLTFNLGGYSIENYGASKVFIFLNNLTNLQNLTLGLRSYTKQENFLLPLSSSLMHCQQLKYLSFELDYTFFTETEAEHLRNCISTLVNLTHLSLTLKDNIIDSSLVKLLSSSVQNSNYLESLFFNFNMMIKSEDDQRSLDLQLGNLPKLRDFTILFGESNLSSEEIVCISEAISKLKSLVNLNINLKKSKIDENIANNIGSSISNLLGLSGLEMNLQDCDFQRDSISPILLAIQNLNQLTSLTLNLVSNEIETSSSENLSSCISQLQNLQSFNLSISGQFISSKSMKEFSNNQFSIKQLKNKKLESIFSAITTLMRLSSLDLRLWDFYYEGNIGISVWLKKLPYLQHFSLKFISCCLQYADIDDISLGISKLSNLQSLQIESYYQREIAKTWYDLVSPGITKLKDLKVLICEYQINQLARNKIYAKNSRLVILGRKLFK